VYQTGHGAAHDLAGADRANPAGHLLSLAMLLRHSLALPREAAAVEAALQRVWADGWRTADVARGAEPHQVVGLRELARRVADAVASTFDER
jgi:3-isopropylmalate dehydrogenase